MHIPDGFLDGKTAVATYALGLAGLGAALWHAHSNLPRRRVPLMGLCGAFIFAAQMLNFPVAAGASGHLIGGVLAAALVGPGAAVVVISAVLIVQCLLFQDGGITTLGANVLNLAVVNSVGGYFLYRGVMRLVPGAFGRVAAVAFAAWCATVLAAVVCAGELAVSKKISWSVALPAMTYVHMLIGCGEAFLTAMIIAGVASSRPELLFDPARENEDAPTRWAWRRHGVTIAFGLLIALALAMFASPFASTWPDGLDLVAKKFGIAEADAKLTAPIADYSMPGIGSEFFATAIAGAIGTVIAFGLSFLLARVLVPRGRVAMEDVAHYSMGHHHGFLADYSGLDSPIHRLPVALKFAVALAMVIATLAMPMTAGWFFVASVVALVVIAAVSRIPPFFLIKRIAGVETFVLFAAVLSLFQPNGGRVFVQILLKSSLCLSWMILLANTTPFASLIELMRRLRVPSLLLTTLTLMYRYLFVLREEALRLRRARASRTFARSRTPSWKMLASMLRVLMSRTLARADRVYAAMCAGLDVIDPDANRTAPPAVEVRGLHFHYASSAGSSGQIHDISFVVGEGECVGIIGPNGAGKSTLLLHLNGLLPESFTAPPSVHIFSEAVTSRTLASVRREVGFLFQDPDDQLFCPTVFDDVAFGPKQLGWPADRIESAVADALARVRLSGFEKRSPHQLSGGEKRRACLAGLLAAEARILVLDEPTTSLDPRSRRELIAILASISATKIIATHDLEMVAELCERVIVLDEGRIVAQGASRHILNDEPLMLAHGLERPASFRA